MSDIAEPTVEVPVKLFVGRFPRDFSDEDLERVFAAFGKLKECTILRDHGSKDSKGCGFVRFAHLAHAIECIKQTNGVLVVDPSIGPVQVQFANGEIERLGLSPDQIESPPTKVFVGSLPSDFSTDQLLALFTPFGDVVEAFILEDKGSGFVKMRTKPQALDAIEALNKKVAAAPTSDSGGPGKPLEVRLAVSKLQRQRKLMSVVRDRPAEPVLCAPRLITAKAAGPVGCNVFVFHIPADWTEFHLRQYFGNHGFLLSATVVRDKQTNISRGFGFVSFDNPYSAQSAVVHMNGFMVAGKRLKVQLKRGEDGLRHMSGFAMVGGG